MCMLFLEKVLLFEIMYSIIALVPYGGVAQLGARLNGIQKVEGSIPFVSTNEKSRNIRLLCGYSGICFDPIFI